MTHHRHFNKGVHQIDEPIVVNDGDILEGAKEEKEEEILPLATDQEQKDFEEYQKEVKKQEKVITSYEDLLKKKENDEKQKEINKLLQVINSRYTKLHAQEYKDPNIRDRLGKRGEFYLEIFNNMKNNQDKFLDGDIDKQHELLSLLASGESDRRPADLVLQDLKKFHRDLSKQLISYQHTYL